MRPHGSAQQLEQRRRRAVALRQEGYGAIRIARLLNTTPQSVGRWLETYEQGGLDALAPRPTPGRPCRLNARQKRSLVAALLQGASACGFGTDLWTCPRIAQWIAQRWGVLYHVDHIPRLMASLGFSPAEARAASLRTRPGGHPPLADARLAPHQAPRRPQRRPPGIHR